MIIKQIYLYSNILENIINYIYKRSRFFEIPQNNNEIINYSLVSKSWFSIISKLISNIQTLKNHDHLKGLIQDQPNSKVSSNIQSFKLIKYTDASLYTDNYYEIMNHNNNTEIDPNFKNYYRKIINYNYSFDVDVESFENLPYNYKFRAMNLKTFLDKSKDYDKDISKVKCIRVFSKYELLKAIELNIKRSFYVEKYDNKFNIYIRFKKSGKIKIDIDDLFIPSSNSNSLSKLKKFYTKLSANNLLETLKDNICNNDIKDTWEYVVNKLSNCHTFTELIYFHFCSDEICGCCGNINNISKQEFNEGIKRIISSPNTNLKTLRFSPGKIEECIYESLKVNQTIRDISIQAQCFTNLIQKILIVNKTIRNVLVNARDCEKDEVYLVEALRVLVNPVYLNQIELYSLSIQTNSENLNQIINELKIDKIKFNIKEINIINTNTTLYNNNQYIYNNTIFNIQNYII